MGPKKVSKKKKDGNGAAAGPRSNPGRRLSLGGFLGRRESATGADSGAAGTSPTHDDDATAKGIRKSLQRALGFGHDRSGSNVSNSGPVIG